MANPKAYLKLIEAHRLLLDAFELALKGGAGSTAPKVEGKEEKSGISSNFITEEDDAIIEQKIELDRQQQLREWEAHKVGLQGLQSVFEEGSSLSPELEGFLSNRDVGQEE